MWEVGEKQRDGSQPLYAIDLAFGMVSNDFK